jgi:transcription antitermination factor NusG
MTEVLHANVFFFITGIAVIIISVILCILLYHIVRAMKSVRRILGNIERGAEVLSEDAQNIRSYFIKGGLIGGIMSILRGVTEKTPTKSSPKKTKNTELKITDSSR